MKKIFTLLSLFIFSVASYSQICTDTVRYIYDGKASTPIAYTMAVDNEVNTAQLDDGFPKYGQKYFAPDSIKITGVCFYAWVEDIGFGTVSVDVKIQSIDGTGIPDTAMTEKSIDIIDWPGYFVTGEFTSENIMHCVEFDSSVTVMGDYAVTLETTTNRDLYVGANSAPDGAGEGNGLLYYYWLSNPSFDGWYLHSAFGAAWDFDWGFMPVVEYDFSHAMTIADDTLCLGDTLVLPEDTITIESAIFKHKMYNPNYMTDTLVQVVFSYDYGDGNSDSDTTHQYATGGDYTVTMVDTAFVPGWGLKTCEGTTQTADIHVDDSTEITDYTYVDNFNKTIDFTSVVINADSVLWDFGDGTTDNTADPSHTFPDFLTYNVKLYAYGPCSVVDSLEKNTYPRWVNRRTKG